MFSRRGETTVEHWLLSLTTAEFWPLSDKTASDMLGNKTRTSVHFRTIVLLGELSASVKS